MTDVIVKLGWQDYAVPVELAEALVIASMHKRIRAVDSKYIDGEYFHTITNVVEVTAGHLNFASVEQLQAAQHKKDQAELQKLRDQVALLEASHNAPVDIGVAPDA